MGNKILIVVEVVIAVIIISIIIVSLQDTDKPEEEKNKEIYENKTSKNNKRNISKDE